MTTLSAEQLNRATLERQLLLERADIPVADAVGRIGGIQAQSPPSPYLSLWARLQRFDPGALDAALADATLVKATLMRLTLHLVRAQDFAPFHYAMQPTLRGARVADRRITDAGLDAPTIDALVHDVMGQLRDRPHTNADAEKWVGRALGEVEGAQRYGRGYWAWWALRHYVPLRHHVTGGPWGYGQRPAFTDSGVEALVPFDPVPADEALGELIVSYLRAFGPASAKDIDQFTMVRQRRIKPAIAALGDRLVRYAGPDGGELFDVAGGTVPDGDTPAPPRLLPMWDSTLLAYSDRSRILPEDYRRTIIRVGGDTLPTVLVNGHVAGIWRSLETSGGESGDGIGIEITAFQPFDDATWDGLQAEAASLRTLLADREPEPYRRFHGWWPKLGREGHVRVL